MNASRFGFRVTTAIVLCCGMAGRLSADPITYSLNDTANNVSATATFHQVSGGFYIEITNTEANTASAAQAISQFKFTVSNDYAMPTAMTEITGNSTTFVGGTTPVDITTTTNSADHWSYSTSGANGNVFDVNGPIGQPKYLIAASGSTPDASLTNTHLPSFVGPVDFYFSDPMGAPTAGEITGFQFAFGTKPEVPLENAILTPAPSSFVLMGMAMLCLVGWGLMSRLRRKPVLA